jgi:hypothetical protein
MYLRPSLLLLALAPAALVLSGGCSKADKDNATAVVNDIKTTAVDTWDGIKDFTYEQRVEFSASIDRMSRSLDDNTTPVRARVASMPDAAAKDKEAALRDYDAARADLKTDLVALDNATADNWADAKAKVAAAWRRVQASYDNATK